jgi:hypothetical protein
MVDQPESRPAAEQAPCSAVPESKTQQYPERKQRELTDGEKQQLRERIEKGDVDIYALACEFGCSSSQVAGIKAAMSR